MCSILNLRFYNTWYNLFHLTQFSNCASETNHLSSPNSSAELRTLVCAIREEVLRVTEQFENKLMSLNSSEGRQSAGGHLFLQKTEHSDTLIPLLPVELCPPVGLNTHHQVVQELYP